MNSNTPKTNLSEALKKYNLLSEYNFYIPREDDGMYKGEEDTMEEQDAPVEDVAAPAADENLPVPTTEVPMDAAPAPADTTPVTPEPTPTPGGEVEVDVTDIVKDTKETKEAVNSGNQKVDELMAKLSDLETKLASMNDLVDKINELESEFEKRNPTPEEKLEMRSLDSFPYNLKLTDYWSQKEGAYNVIDHGKDGGLKTPQGQPIEKEYVLTQNDVESDYNEGEISDTFYDKNY